MSILLFNPFKRDWKIEIIEVMFEVMRDFEVSHCCYYTVLIITYFLVLYHVSTSNNDHTKRFDIRNV